MDYSPIGAALKTVISLTAEVECTFVRETGSWADVDSAGENRVTKKCLVKHEEEELERKATITIDNDYKPNESDQVILEGVTWKIVGVTQIGAGKPLGYLVGVTR